MSLKGVAPETLSIVEQGGYVGPGGRRVELGAAVRAAIAGTRLYRPEEAQALLESSPATTAGSTGWTGPSRVEVTGETTAAAGRRLAAEGERRILLLNYASARNPGGGFLGGAKAQEEDLCRCSALYGCLITQPAYYDENRANRSLLYTDHLIYSPGVPFFRDDRLGLLDEAVALSVITSPAPNAGALAKQQPEQLHLLRSTLERRGGQILAVAQSQGYRVLVLGAWGCGAFHNDPQVVAEVLRDLLTSERFRGAFDRVIFGVYDRADRAPNRSTFERVLGRAGGRPS